MKKINISSSDTNSGSDHGSDDSNFYFIPDHDMEVESQGSHSESDESIDEMGYTDEPLPDEEWLKKNNQEDKENKNLEKMLQKRLDDTKHVDSW